MHSRVISVIVNICYKLNYEVEMERGFYYSKKSGKVLFRPDISIYKENKLVGIIEYESTNSSDSRFYDQKRDGKSNLRCLQGCVSNEESDLPKVWIVITTLPKHSVNQNDWKSRDFPKKSPKFQKLIKSPFDYYFPKYVEETKKILSANKIRTEVFLLNIDSNEVKLEFSRTC